MFGIGKTRKANATNERADVIASVAQKKVTKARNELNDATSKFGQLKLEIYGGTIREFVEEIGKIKEIDFKDNLSISDDAKLEIGELQLKEMGEMSIKATDMLKGVVTGTGAGVLSGMALGSVVLGGIVALPALLIASGIMDAKGKECLNVAMGNLHEAKKLDSDANVVLKQVEVIKECISQNTSIINRINCNAKRGTAALIEITKNKNNWKELTNAEKETVFAEFKTVQLLKNIIETPLLDSNGNLTKEIQNVNTQNI